MELAVGENSSIGHADSLLRHQHNQDDRPRHSRPTKNIIIAVLILVSLLCTVLMVVFAMRPNCNDTGKMTWLEEKCEEITEPDCPASFTKPPVILVSLDGFRSEYMSHYRELLPNINKLRNCGTSAEHMRPSYPTKTFPNHYTIVTGLYPESHGIVDNKMYDVTRNASFSLKVKEKFNPLWYLGEPIWITAMKNKLKTGTFFWPGSDVPIQGKYPDYYMKYDRSVSFKERINKIFTWLNLPPKERPDFYTLYFEEPDSAGHRYGPLSSQVITALLQVDEIIGLLMEGLKQRKLHKCVNIILLSDHGMEEASCEKAVYVSSYQNHTDDFIVIQGPAARVRPSRVPEEFFTFDYSGLVQNLSCRAPNQPMKPYLKENLPKRLHFAKSIRIERVHLYMMPQWQAALKKSELKYCTGGFHGSDNVFKSMQAIFIGYGPGLKFNTVVPPFENIEVYNVLCDLLDISPAPNNGTHGSLNHILSKPRYKPDHPAERSQASNCSTILSSNMTQDCFCNPSIHQVKDLSQLLMKSMSDFRIIGLHSPYGLPRVLQEKVNYCVLQHSSYISGYSKDIQMPLWVSYSLQNLMNVPHPRAPQETCVRGDMRIPASDSQPCSFYNESHILTFGFLHPPYLLSYGSESESLITSNMAPMFPVFKGIWDYIHSTALVKFVNDQREINIVSGPIFDLDFDGRFDHMTGRNRRNRSLIPTHYYIVITSCTNISLSLSNCDADLETLSFILPHHSDTTETCHNGRDYSWVQDWMKLHVGRIRDIELLTGLSFYTQLPVTKTLQLKMFLKTF